MYNYNFYSYRTRNCVTTEILPMPPMSPLSAVAVPVMTPDASHISVKQPQGAPVNKPVARPFPLAGRTLARTRRDPRLARFLPAPVATPNPALVIEGSPAPMKRSPTENLEGKTKKIKSDSLTQKLKIEHCSEVKVKSERQADTSKLDGSHYISLMNQVLQLKGKLELNDSKHGIQEESNKLIRPKCCPSAPYSFKQIDERVNETGLLDTLPESKPLMQDSGMRAPPTIINEVLAPTRAGLLPEPPNVKPKPINLIQQLKTDCRKVKEKSERKYGDGKQDSSHYNNLMNQVLQLKEKIGLKEDKQRESFENTKRKVNLNLEQHYTVISPELCSNEKTCLDEIDERVNQTALLDSSNIFMQNSDMRVPLTIIDEVLTLPIVGLLPAPPNVMPKLLVPQNDQPDHKIEECPEKKFYNRSRTPFDPRLAIPVLPVPQIGMCQGKCPLEIYQRSISPPPLAEAHPTSNDLPPFDFGAVQSLKFDMPRKTVKIPGLETTPDKPASRAVLGNINVNDLFSKLVATGIVSLPITNSNVVDEEEEVTPINAEEEDDDVILKTEPVVQVEVSDSDTDDETVAERTERDQRYFHNVKVKQEPVDPDDEPIITAEEPAAPYHAYARESGRSPPPFEHAVRTGVHSSIDGNVQLEAAPAPPAPAAAIRINISKRMGLSSPPPTQTRKTTPTTNPRRPAKSRSSTKSSNPHSRGSTSADNPQS